MKEKLDELLGLMKEISEAADAYENSESLPRESYKTIRQKTQDAKKAIQSFREAVLEDFKGRINKKS